MNTLYIRVRRTSLIAGLLVLLLTMASQAQDGEVKVPFLFSDDETLDQTELNKVIPRSRDLQGDPYLNAPMTRLKYMLTMLETGLNSEQDRSVVHKQLSDAFEYSRAKLPKTVSTTGFARYSRETGRIAVGYRIEGVGKPKKAMRTTCDDILSKLKIVAPQGDMGYLYHNTVLGVLAQDDYSKYTPALEILERSIVHKVILVSQTEELRVTHALICQRTGKDAPIQYYRYSFKPPEEDRS